MVATAEHVLFDGAVVDGDLSGDGRVNLRSAIMHGAVLTAAIQVPDGAVVDDDTGGVADVGTGSCSVGHALTGTIHVIQNTAVDNHLGVVDDDAFLAAAIDVVLHSGIVSVDGHLGVIHLGQFGVVGIATATAEDLAALLIRAHAHIGDAAHINKSGVRYRSHEAAAIDVVLNGAATHVHMGAVMDQTRYGVELCCIVLIQIGVGTTSATKEVAIGGSS